MSNKFTIRQITESDTNEVLEVFKPYVINTAITLEYDVPTTEEFLHRIKTNTVDYPWLICLYNNKIVGYAYASKRGNREGLKWSTESTIYFAGNFHGKGLGRVLYDALFNVLQLQGYFNVYAGVILPNEKSEALHKALGFSEVGGFSKVGYKLGKWRDCKWFQLHLSKHIVNPAKPKTLQEVKDSEAFKAIIATANSRSRNINSQNLKLIQ